MADTEYRVEHDTMGEVKVPAKALWRAQTQRAVENFPISGRGLERTQIRALGLLKGACAQVNKDLGLLAADKADAIIAAAAEIADGKHDEQFPIDVFQTGSGTSSNMNTNEVIASIAAANGVTVHPNDDVNMSQSSNDTFPTATHIAATEAAVRHLIPALQVLHDALAGKSREWHTVVKSGRTHLMDAVPVTLGQEFSGYARQIEAGIERVRATLPRLGELAIGGTAVGTGLNAPDGFGAKVVQVLVKDTGLTELRTATNSFEAQAARDGLVEASGALRTIAVSLTKIANDVRWMGSGPLTGLAEIQLPDLQPGSSIMPGKVNPVLPEAVTQVAAQVIGNDAAVAVGGLSGAFELNVYIPMMARNVLESFKLLTNVSTLFAERCIVGLHGPRRAPAGAGRVVPVDRDAAELGDRLRGSGRSGQASTQGAQDNSADGDRPRVDRRQAVRRRTRPSPRRAGDGQSHRGVGMLSDELRQRRLALIEEHMNTEVTKEFDRTLATFNGHPHYEIMATGQVFDGDDEVMGYYRTTRTAFPDQRHDNVRYHVTDDAVITEFDLLGTNLGEFYGMPPTGKAFRVPIIAVFFFDGDRITNERIYFDSASLVTQIGRGELLALAASGELPGQ